MINHDRLMQICDTITGGAGVFLEAGANDGIRQSNTLRLELECNWSGVLVEPSPAAFSSLAHNRPEASTIHAALVAHDYEQSSVRGAFLDGQLTGTLVPSLMPRSADLPRTRLSQLSRRLRKVFRFGARVTQVEVRAITLNQCLQEAGISRIDFLSLDVEGYEVEVLNGLDTSRYRPALILVEVRDFVSWDLLQWTYQNGYVVIEKLSDFAESGSLHWTGDHEDYLLVDRSVLAGNSELRLLLGLG